MLNVRFGFDAEAIRDIDLYFENVYEEEWMEDSFVQQMILDIDQSVVKGDLLIVSPVLGQIPPERLSGGVKALICMYKMDAYIDLIVCGPNCENYILQIASEKDVTVSMSGYDLSFIHKDIHAVCLNDMSKIDSSYEWIIKMSQFVDEE